MPQNVEIKARLADREALLQRALRLATEPPQALEQDDSFFPCPNGRLKLRCLADGTAELIFYQRADGLQTRLSAYWRCPVIEPDTLRDTLTRAYGSGGRVRKQRLLVMAGRTRIHIDRVEGLGDFLELEVVMRDGEPLAEGQAEAEQLLRALQVPPEAHVAGAYRDLLAAGTP